MQVWHSIPPSPFSSAHSLTLIFKVKQTNMISTSTGNFYYLKGLEASKTGSMGESVSLTTVTNIFFIPFVNFIFFFILFLFYFLDCRREVQSSSSMWPNESSHFGIFCSLQNNEVNSQKEVRETGLLRTFFFGSLFICFCLVFSCFCVFLLFSSVGVSHWQMSCSHRPILKKWSWSIPILNDLFK